VLNAVEPTPYSEALTAGLMVEAQSGRQGVNDSRSVIPAHTGIQ
jgi:hypothetical protein